MYCTHDAVDDELYTLNVTIYMQLLTLMPSSNPRR